MWQMTTPLVLGLSNGLDQTDVALRKVAEKERQLLMPSSWIGSIGKEYEIRVSLAFSELQFDCRMCREIQSSHVQIFHFQILLRLPL